MVLRPTTAAVAALMVMLAGTLAGCVEAEPEATSERIEDLRSDIAELDEELYGSGDPVDDMEHDDEVYGEIRFFTKRWNRILTPVVRDYLNPNVPAEVWVSRYGDVPGKLMGVHSGIAAASFKLRDSRLRNMTLDIADTYQKKLEAFGLLLNAVATGRVEAQLRAQRILDKEGRRSTRLARKMMTYIDSKAG